jgi:hypothetical protein
MKKDKEIGKIYESYDYDKFHRYEWNRVLNQNTLRKIDKSVQEDGWKKEPIIVNEEYGIYDGQHRYVYAKENKLPLYYIIIPGLTKEDCQRMNVARTSWVVRDYINFYSALGNTSYLMLANLDSKYPFDYGVILYALIGMTYGGGTKIIQNGKFECSSEQYNNAIEKLDYLTDLLYSIKAIKGRRTQLCWAIMYAYELPKIDKNRLAKVIKENCNHINPPVDMETALSEIERIYNYKINKENKIFFTLEWKKNK